MDSTSEYSSMDHNALEKSSLTFEKWHPSRQVKLVIFTQSLACFVVSLDATILTTTLPNLSQALHVDTTKAFWIASAYLLASAVMQPPIASLSDIFGRRAIYLLAVISFTIGTLICCTCNNIAGMLAGRVIQGIGGGGILSLNLIILSDLVPLRDRSTYQGYLQLVFALGSNLAPMIAGALIENTTWRWLFYINLPFCAAGLLAAPLLLKYQTPTSELHNKFLSIDWVGISLFVVSITVFLVGISWGGNQYSWSSAGTLAPIILGVIGVIATFSWEVYGAKKPFFRLSLFNNGSGILIYVCTVMMAFLIYGSTYYLILWLLTVKGYSQVIAGVGALPFGLTIVPVSGITGKVISKTGIYQPFIRAGWVICTLGIGLLVLLHVHTSIAAWILIFLVVGVGQGLLMISLSVAAQATSPTKDVAYASSTYAFMRSLGLCFGVSIGGTIFQNFLRMRLQTLGLDVAIAHNAEGYAVVLRAMAAGAEKDELLGAYSWAFRMLFATMTGISGAGMLLGFAIKRFSLDIALESEHVLVHNHVAVAQTEH